jgi:cellulose synthase/poly-beta-1,6-N-acetylglucosamine synthase-like glycosyltransferase
VDPLDGEKIVAGVVIACHTEERWDSIMRAIASVQHQTVAAAQVIVAVDHNDSLGARLREVSEIEVVDHRGPAGASGTRNTGATLVRAPVIAFLDDDARAHPDWLGELLRPLSDPGVVGTGGTISPAWSGAAPRWFPGEFGWVVGASYTGLPDSTGPVRNVWSGNMAVRRDAFDAVGGFRPEFGKLGMASRPEDTDLCLRIHANAPQTSWIYVPAAVVEHEVPDSRAKFGFFLRRCYSEGGGKIELSAHLAEDRNLVDERVYLLRTVPHGVGRAVRERNLGRALAIIAGVIAAGAGALSSLVRLRPIKARAGLS